MWAKVELGEDRLQDRRVSPGPGTATNDLYDPDRSCTHGGPQFHQLYHEGVGPDDPLIPPSFGGPRIHKSV